MIAEQHALDAKTGAHYTVQLPRSDDFGFWRERARHMLQCDVRPEQLSWIEPGGAQDLFGFDAAQSAAHRLPEAAKPAANLRVPRRFMQLARNAALHSDGERFALLYRLLWRLQSAPGLVNDSADPDVRRVEELDKSVRRDSHKMHAFVRFRQINDVDGAEHYVAWFEPDHHIVRANAGFFRRRFANMRWSILTPRGSIHWDGKTMREGPPAQRSDAPDSDAMEDLWRSYYASTFNPARLKIGAMLSEMPRKYWQNMPEAELIPQLIAGAQAREAGMVAAGSAGERKAPRDLADIAAGIAQCQMCPIAACGTRAVLGEGAKQGTPLMILGEQPGDVEDRQGRPFVGPAGQLLDRHLSGAGIDRRRAYVTNAVKHFKFYRRGKRRIHQAPSAKEIDSCRWWLDAERALVRPKLVLALGASAARGVLGKTVNVNQMRGAPLALAEGGELWITLHPAHLLRLEGEARANREALFARDLAAVAARIEQLAG